MPFPTGHNLNDRRSGASAEIFILIIIYIGFFSVTRVVGIEELASNAFAAKYIRVASIFTAFLGSIIILLKRNALFHFNSPLIFSLFLYFLACILSVPNSLFPSLSLIKSIEIFQANLLCLIAITTSQSTSYNFFRIHGRLILLVAVFIVIESILFPLEAWQTIPGDTPFQGYMLRGVYPSLNPNTVGLIGGIIAAIHLPKMILLKNKINVILTFFGFAIVVLSYSRSSLIAIIASTLCILYCLRKKTILLFIVTSISSFLIFFPSYIDSIYNHLIRGQDIETLSSIVADRPLIWGYIWDLNHKSLFGLGLGAAFRHPVLSMTGWGHAHNTFFQVMADLGLAGVLTWLIMITLIIQRLYKYYKDTNYRFSSNYLSILSVFIFLLAKSYGHSTLYIFNYDFIVLVSIIIYIEKEHILEKRFKRGQNG